MVSFVKITSELGAGTRGSSLGYNALLTASIESGDSIFKQRDIREIPHENHLLLNSDSTPRAKNIEGISRIYDRISDEIRKLLGSGVFPVVIAGDHSTAGGTIAGVKTANADKRVGVIWIDAHADLHSPFTTPSGNVHGMPLATAIGFDNEELAKEPVDGLTRGHWNALKTIGGISPKVLPEDIVFVGVRSTEPEEEAIINKHQIRNHEVSEVRNTSAESVASKVIEDLKDVDIIYISFDVDSMDPEISRGTGTPVPGGFAIQEAKDLICALLKEPKVKCFEIVEVNPLLDEGNKMGKAAYGILQSAVETIEKRTS